MSVKTNTSLSPGPRVLLSLVLPFAGAILFSLIVSGRPSFGGLDPRHIALQMAGVGLVSWILGWQWYGLNGLGLRLGRPLYSSIGFAVLAWIIFIIARLVLVEPGPNALDVAGVPFLFLLIFEAFCVQLWCFGLIFRSVVDWRGPLTASVISGILFGAVAVLTFQESFGGTATGALFFGVWGILYGTIRLRTGSLLGTVLVQALQSWTSWQLFPVGLPDIDQLRNLYFVTSALNGILIWRLWPKKTEDYRV